MMFAEKQWQLPSWLCIADLAAHSFAGYGPVVHTDSRSGCCGPAAGGPVLELIHLVVLGPPDDQPRPRPRPAPAAGNASSRCLTAVSSRPRAVMLSATSDSWGCTGLVVTKPIAPTSIGSSLRSMSANSNAPAIVEATSMAADSVLVTPGKLACGQRRYEGHL